MSSLNSARLPRVVVLCGVMLCLASGCDTGPDLVIINARLIDGTGAAPVTDVSILVSGDRIEAIRSGAVEVNGAIVIDANGRTVMPGLSDLHVHSTIEFWTDSDRFDFSDEEFMEVAITSDADLEEFMAERLPARLRSFLESGVTTIVDPGGFWPFVVDVRDRVEAGELLGPRMYVVGPVFTAPGTHPASTGCNNEPWCVEHLTCATDDEEVARQCVRDLAESGVDGLKFVYNPEGLKRNVMEAIIDEGHRHGLPVAAHVGPTDLVAHAVKAGVDVLVHAPLERNGELRTSEGEDLPVLLKRFNVPITTTVQWGDLNRVPEDRRERIIRAIETMVGPSLKAHQAAGVTLLFGTDFAGNGTPPDLRQLILSEINVLRLAGLSNAEVIQAMTGNMAKHPMTPEDIGTIEPGKLADIIIVDDDPLTNIESITYPWVVIKGGQIVVDKR